MFRFDSPFAFVAHLRMLGKAYAKDENPKSRINFYSEAKFNVDGVDLDVNQLKGAFWQMMERMNDLLKILRFGERRLEWKSHLAQENFTALSQGFGVVVDQSKVAFQRIYEQENYCS